MSVSVAMSVVTISGLSISGPLAVVSVSTAIAVSVAVTSIAVSSAVVAIAGLGISGPLAVVSVVSVGVGASVTVVAVSVAVTVVAVAGLSGSSGLGISLSLRLGISSPLAVVSTVSAIPVIASPVSSIAIATAVVTISGLGRHHSEEGDGESDQKFHVLSSSFSTGLPMYSA